MKRLIVLLLILTMSFSLIAMPIGVTATGNSEDARQEILNAKQYEYISLENNADTDVFATWVDIADYARFNKSIGGMNSHFSTTNIIVENAEKKVFAWLPDKTYEGVEITGEEAYYVKGFCTPMLIKSKQTLPGYAMLADDLLYAEDTEIIGHKYPANSSHTPASIYDGTLIRTKVSAKVIAPHVKERIVEDGKNYAIIKNNGIEHKIGPVSANSFSPNSVYLSNGAVTVPVEKTGKNLSLIVATSNVGGYNFKAADTAVGTAPNASMNKVVVNYADGTKDTKYFIMTKVATYGKASVSQPELTIVYAPKKKVWTVDDFYGANKVTAKILNNDNAEEHGVADVSALTSADIIFRNPDILMTDEAQVARWINNRQDSFSDLKYGSKGVMANILLEDKEVESFTMVKFFDYVAESIPTAIPVGTSTSQLRQAFIPVTVKGASDEYDYFAYVGATTDYCALLGATVVDESIKEKIDALNLKLEAVDSATIIEKEVKSLREEITELKAKSEYVLDSDFNTTKLEKAEERIEEEQTASKRVEALAAKQYKYVLLEANANTDMFASWKNITNYARFLRSISGGTNHFATTTYNGETVLDFLPDTTYEGDLITGKEDYYFKGNYSRTLIETRNSVAAHIMIADDLLEENETTVTGYRYAASSSQSPSEIHDGTVERKEATKIVKASHVTERIVEGGKNYAVIENNGIKHKIGPIDGSAYSPNSVYVNTTNSEISIGETGHTLSILVGGGNYTGNKYSSFETAVEDAPDAGLEKVIITYADGNTATKYFIETNRVNFRNYNLSDAQLAIVYAPKKDSWTAADLYGSSKVTAKVLNNANSAEHGIEDVTTLTPEDIVFENPDIIMTESANVASWAYNRQDACTINLSQRVTMANIPLEDKEVESFKVMRFSNYVAEEIPTSIPVGNNEENLGQAFIPVTVKGASDEYDYFAYVAAISLNSVLLGATVVDYSVREKIDAAEAAMSTITENSSFEEAQKAKEMYDAVMNEEYVLESDFDADIVEEFNRVYEIIKAETEKIYTYTVTDGKATITAVDTSISGNITIPSYLGGCPVTTIDEFAFAGCTELTNIVIPDTVTTIGSCAFEGCAKLTDMIIPDSVTSISSFPFSGCTNLKSVVIGDGLKTIGDELFSDCTSLTTVTIGRNIEKIGDCAFYGCSKLTSIEIPDSVTTIGMEAFKKCENLISVKIGNGLTVIGDMVFSDCTSLKNVEIGNNVSTIGSQAFYGCSKLENIKIPNNVKKIADLAFAGCSGATRIEIGTGLTSVEGMAFEGCTNADVYIKDLDAWCNIEFDSYYSNPLYYAKKLYVNNEVVTNLVITEGITKIGDYAFFGYDEFISIEIPVSVKTMGDNIVDEEYLFGKTLIVYYRGNKTQWDNLTKYTSNSELTDDKWGACVIYNAQKVTFKDTEDVELLVKWMSEGQLPSGIELEVQEGKRATFYTDKECTKLFDMSTEITEDTVLYCTFMDAYCTYKFLNGDGSVMFEKTVDYGATLNETPTTIPTKAATQQYTYTFSNWDGYSAGMTLTKDMTFTPVFNSTVNKYTYKFLNEDGSVHFERTANYGTKIELPSELTKASTSQYNYTFSEWNGYTEGMTVTQDVTFTPEFTTTVRQYTYKFVDDDGTVISEKTADYGTVIESPVNNPVKDATTQYTYIFDKWSGYVEGVPLTRDIAFTATYKAILNQYTYKFLNEDGTVCFEKTADYGSVIEVPASPVKQATAQYTYTFSKWIGYTDGMKVSGDVSFTPEFTSEVNKYTYTFYDEDGTTVLKTETVDYGTTIVAPADPTKTATAQYTYSFKEWEGFTAGMTLTEDVTFKAVYDATVNQYTYVFYDEDGTTVLKTATVDFGTVIELPQTPEKPADDKYSYVFVNWDGYAEGMTITKDITFIAVYDAIYRQNIELTGITSVTANDVFTEKINMITKKPVNYLVCEIIYPDVLKLNSITPIDFKYASQESLETKDGFNYLTVICQYSDDETTVPENTVINPFNLSFVVSKTAKPQDIEIKFGEDTYLSGEEDYPFENKINAKIEILPKLASSITITGNSTIYEPTKFTAEVYPDYTTDKTISWSVDDETVATISKDGVLTPVKNGSVTIKATAVGGSYRTKTVNVYRNAYVDSLKSDVGMWNKEFYPDIKEYTIYVAEDTETISITPLFTTGTLKYNDIILIKNRTREFELSDNETTITLARSDAGYNDSTYIIKIIKTPSEAKVDVKDNGDESIKMEIELPQDMLKQAMMYVLVKAQNAKGVQLHIKGKNATNETNIVSIDLPKKDDIDNHKALFWESLANLKPVYAPITKEF